MKIFLFGATGGTGREVLIKLLEQKHQVFVLARNPEDLNITDDYLKIIKGSVFTPETYYNELSECDLVISALGATSRMPTDIYSKGGQQIISAMKAAKIKRLITLTAAAFDPTDPHYNNFFLRFIIRPLLKNMYSDMQQWETILEGTPNIDWTVIRPSQLLNGKERGKYRVQIDHCPKGGSKIRRSDLADFIVKQISSDEYIHKKVAIAY